MTETKIARYTPMEQARAELTVIEAATQEVAESFANYVLDAYRAGATGKLDMPESAKETRVKLNNLIADGFARRDAERERLIYDLQVMSNDLIQLIEVNTQLLAALEEAASIAYVEATKRSTAPRRYLPSWYEAARAAIAAATSPSRLGDVP